MWHRDLQAIFCIGIDESGFCPATYYDHDSQLYKDEMGKSKGEALLTFEEPNSAHASVAFFHNTELKGNKIKVTMVNFDHGTSESERESRGGDGGGYGGGGRGGMY